MKLVYVLSTAVAVLPTTTGSSAGPGLSIARDAAVITMGVDEDVSLERTADRELTVNNDLVVNGNTNLNATTASSLTVEGDLEVDQAITAGSMTIQGHLEVDETISTGFGRITRDFHQYYVYSSSNRNGQYYNMRTTIPVHENVMYRLEILGYAYGESANIDSVTTGYTYHGWDCVNNEAHVDFGDGAIDVYCDVDDEYLVLEFYLPDWYYTGLTVSGWFLNPNGIAHDIEITETALVSSDDYWASSSRQLQEDEPRLEAGNAKLDDNVELDEKTGRPIAEPVKHDNGEKRFSMRDLANEVLSLREEVAKLRETVKELSS